MDIDPTALGAILTGLGLGGIVVSLIAWARGREGDKADAAQTLVESAALGVDVLSKTVAELRSELDEVKAELDEVREDVRHLRETERKHVAWAGMNGIWPPDQATWDSL